MAESISVFGVKISDTRGKKRECDICGNSFTLLIKEHQCKRCKRAVCYNCSQAKSPVYRMKKFSEHPHRCCKRCKIESESLQKFIKEHKLVFGKDTISKEWLDALQNKSSYQEMNTEYFEFLNDPRFEEKLNNGDDSDKNTYLLYKKTENNIEQIYQGFQDQFNYSLQEFLFFVIGKIDSGTVCIMIKNIMKAFLCKNPKFGLSQELPIFIIFILCFASEPAAFKIIDLFYGDFFPKQLYPYSIQKNGFQYQRYISLIMQLMQYVFKFNQNELNLMSKYLEYNFMSLTGQMTINMMTFENTFLIIDSTIKAGCFTQYLKCLAAIVKHKCKEILNFGGNVEKMQVILLRNVDSNVIRTVLYDIENINEETQKKLSEQFSLQDNAAPHGVDNETFLEAIINSQDYRNLEKKVKEQAQQLQALTNQNMAHEEAKKQILKDLEASKKQVNSIRENNKQLQAGTMQLQVALEEAKSKQMVLAPPQDPESLLVKSQFELYQAQLKEQEVKLDLRTKELEQQEADRQTWIKRMHDFQDEKTQVDQIISDLAYNNQELEYKIDQIEGRKQVRNRDSTITVSVKVVEEPPNVELLQGQYRKIVQKLEVVSKRLDSVILEGAEQRMSQIRSQRLMAEAEYERNTLLIQMTCVQESAKKEKEVFQQNRSEQEDALKRQYKMMLDSLQIVYESNDKYKAENEQINSQFEQLINENKLLSQKKLALETENEKLKTSNDELKKITSAADGMENDDDIFAEYIYLEQDPDCTKRRIMKELFGRIRILQQELRFKNIDYLIKKELFQNIQKKVRMQGDTIVKKNEAIEELMTQLTLIKGDNDILYTTPSKLPGQRKSNPEDSDKKSQQESDKECQIF